QWSKIWSIVGGWVFSPILAGLISYALFRSVQKLILDTPDPFVQAKRFVPFYLFLTGFMVSMVTFMKGLKHLVYDLGSLASIGLAAATGLIITFFGTCLLYRFVPCAYN